MKKIALIIFSTFIIIMGFLCYSRFVATKGLITNEITFINSNLPETYNGLKVVHFSDIHYGRTTNYKDLEKITKEINQINPDIVIFTGDLINKKYNLTKIDEDQIQHNLKSIKAKYGKYSILGDNDLKNINTVKSIFLNSNFIILENNSDIIYNKKNDSISITNISTNSSNNIKINADYNILLVHKPDDIDNILNSHDNIDLILSGHSLNGQINIPYIKKLFLPEGAKKYYEPYYKLNNTDLYISSGIGSSNTNFRLNNRPSINLYRIKNKELRQTS